MQGNGFFKKVAYGALAGVAGTVAIQVARSANQKLLPRTTPPMRDDPGQYIVKTIESLLSPEIRAKLPKSLESLASAVLSFGYGSTGAALYTALRADPELLADGAALGSAIWAAGYLGWLPAMGLVPSVDHQKPSQVAASLLQHILYGIATVAAYRKLRAAIA